MTLRLVLAVLVTAGIVLLCLLPGERLPDVARQAPDLLAHAAAFFVLAVAWRNTGVGPWGVLLIGLLVAGATELAQDAMGRGRTGDLVDVVADLVGTVLGVLLVRFFVRARAART